MALWDFHTSSSEVFFFLFGDFCYMKNFGVTHSWEILSLGKLDICAVTAMLYPSLGKDKSLFQYQIWRNKKNKEKYGLGVS